MSVDANLGVQKVHLLLEKTTNYLKTEKIFLKTAQYCSTARVETIFGVLCVSD